MSSVIDVWRAVDPDARLVSGAHEKLARPVRGVVRTRAAPPHLPAAIDGELLVVDEALVSGDASDLDRLLAGIDAAGLAPVALLVAGVHRPALLERAGSPLPVLASALATGALTDAAVAYLDGEAAHLAALVTELRLAGAEAALAEPDPGAPAGVVAARQRRGAAVLIDGRLRSLHPRPAGRALAARFAAAVARLAPSAEEASVARRTRDGLWLLGRRVGPAASAWLFDDLPFARVDEAALEALVVTLRALLRRPAAASLTPAARRRQPPSTGDALRDTLLAVARANGRVAVAARSLGVHRNTVLYRLKRARDEQGIDPRLPEDALRLLREVERRA